LVWDNFGLNPLDTSLPTRVKQAVPVSLLGGTFRVIGAGSVDTVVTLDEISLLWGSNVLETQPVTGSGGTVSVNIGDLVRMPGSQTSMLFAGRSTLGVAAANTLGQVSLSGSSLVTLSKVNGVDYTAAKMVNSIIGGWAVASGDTYAFATYSDTTGVGQMTTFTSGLLTDTTLASGNYNNSATDRTITGSKVANSWRLTGATHVVTFDPGATLTLGAGLVTSGNVVYTLAATAASNTISGSGADGNLYLFASQNTTSIQPKITGSSALVSFGNGTLQLAPKYADNDFTGGAFVNAGILNLSSRGQVSFAAASITPATNTITMADTTGFTVGMVIYNANFPGGTKILTVNSNVSLVVDTNSTNTTTQNSQTVTSRDSWAALPTGGALIIANATVSMSNTLAGQVGEGTNVTIYGSGRLTFGNYASRVGADITHTLEGITFENEGGTVNPEFNLGTPTGTDFVSRFILTSASAINSRNESLSTVPTIRTGSSALTSLEFSNASPTITVDAGAGVVGLNVAVRIVDNAGMTGPLQKAGLGTLALTSSDSTFTTGVNLDAGSLMIGGSSDSPSPTKGPLGTGTLTIAGGTSLFADHSVIKTERTLHNAVVVNGNFTIGGNGNAALTLAGTIDLGLSARTITFATAGITTTFDGAITGTALTKAGDGTLQLGASSSLSLGDAGLTVAAGVIKAGTTDNLSANSLLTVASGAGYDLNGNNQTSNAIAGDGFITNSFNGTSTLTLNVSAGNQTFNGLLADNQSAANPLSYLALDKQGVGILELTNRNTYAGGTTVTDGTLLITGDGSIGPGDVNVVGGATLEYKVAGTSTASITTYDLANIFTGSGDLIFNGDYAVAKIVGDTANAGGLNVSILKGTLQIGDGGTVGSLEGLTSLTIGSGLLDDVATLRFDRSDSYAFGGSISSLATNDGLLLQAGTGTTQLTGSNSGFSGDVQVEAGILDAAASQTLENVRKIVIQSGAELMVSVDDAMGLAGSGLGRDVTINGGILRFLAGTGATFGLVDDLILAGGTVASGTAPAGNSLLLTGSLNVTDNAEISAKKVAFYFGGNPSSSAPAATDISVSLNKTLTFSGTIANPDSGVYSTDPGVYSSVSSFNKKGDGTMILSGNNSAMSGSVTVSNGALVVNHENALGTGSAATNIVTVNSGAYIFSNQNDFATPATPAPIVNTIIVDNGATLGVGTAIGSFSSTSLTLSGGSRIEFKMRDSSQAAGIGYDKFDFGAVNLSGVTTTTPIIIVLKSLDLSGALGEAFNVTKPGAAYVFNFGTFDPTNSNISGNISDLFSFDTTAFTYTGGGSNDAGLWSINFDTANGAITLTAVPEPSTYGFGLGALALAAAAIRRRKRLQQKKA
jgi:autotransporter-associated beta strand protein